MYGIFSEEDFPAEKMPDLRVCPVCFSRAYGSAFAVCVRFSFFAKFIIFAYMFSSEKILSRTIQFSIRYDLLLYLPPAVPWEPRKNVGRHII